MEDFTWLDSLSTDPNIINKDEEYSTEPDILLFHWKRYQYSNQYIGSDGNVKANALGYENWFIGAKKGAPLIKAWKQKFISYYKKDAASIFKDLK